MSPPSEARRALSLDARDNVANALEALAAGDRVAVHGGEVTVREPVPMGHKVALVAIPAGAPVVKFGEPIALASADIAPGCHVHTHNVRTLFDDWLAARTGEGAR